MYRSVFAVASCAAVLFCAALPASSQTIGRIEQVVVYAYGTPPGAARGPAHERDGVVANQRLETVPSGAMLTRFADGTELVLGAGADVTVDRFVYDPARLDAAGLSVTFAKGAFRYVSGAMPKERIELRTRTAQIGIRGTDVTMVVNDAGATNLHVRSGAVTITSRVTGEVAQLEARQSVTIGADGSLGPATGFAGLFFGQTGDAQVDQGLTGSSGLSSPADNIGNPTPASSEGGGGRQT